MLEVYSTQAQASSKDSAKAQEQNVSMQIDKTILKLLWKHKSSQILIYIRKSTNMGLLFFGFFLVWGVFLTFGTYHGNQAQEKKLRVAKGFESRKWLQDIQLFLSKQKNPNLSWQIFFGTFFHVFEVDSAKTRENDGFIDATQREKIGFAPNLAKMLYNPSSIKENSCGAYCRLSASLRVVKSQNSPFPPIGAIKHMEKKGTKKNLST